MERTLFTCVRDVDCNLSNATCEEVVELEPTLRATPENTVVTVLHSYLRPEVTKATATSMLNLVAVPREWISFWRLRVATFDCHTTIRNSEVTHVNLRRLNRTVHKVRPITSDRCCHANCDVSAKHMLRVFPKFECACTTRGND